MEYLHLLFLLVCSLWDIRLKKIPAMWLYIGTICFGLYGISQLIIGHKSWYELVMALLPGIICYLLAKFTKIMGEGDAWLLLNAGFCFSLEILLIILSVTFFFSFLGAIVVVVKKRRVQNQRIPFAPFLFLATVFLQMARGV